MSSFLNELFPNPKCSLNYTKDYELLIAVMLSAQTTDKSVNLVTAVLFKHFPNIESLKNASIEDIEKDIRHIGLSHTKAKNVKAIATILCDSFNGKVPHDKEKLMTMPGVGNKTSNVVLAELFNEPFLAADTHVQRISKRLGFANEKDDALTVEKKLVKQLPKDQIIRINHQIIDFGRSVCIARNPKCENCKLTEFCKFFQAK